MSLAVANDSASTHLHTIAGGEVLGPPPDDRLRERLSSRRWACGTAEWSAHRSGSGAWDLIRCFHPWGRSGGRSAPPASTPAAAAAAGGVPTSVESRAAAVAAEMAAEAQADRRAAVAGAGRREAMPSRRRAGMPPTTSARRAGPARGGSGHACTTHRPAAAIAGGTRQHIARRRAMRCGGDAASQLATYDWATVYFVPIHNGQLAGLNLMASCRPTRDNLASRALRAWRAEGGDTMASGGRLSTSPRVAA